MLDYYHGYTYGYIDRYTVVQFTKLGMFHDYVYCYYYARCCYYLILYYWII